MAENITSEIEFKTYIEDNINNTIILTGSFSLDQNTTYKIQVNKTIKFEDGIVLTINSPFLLSSNIISFENQNDFVIGGKIILSQGYSFNRTCLISMKVSFVEFDISLNNDKNYKGFILKNNDIWYSDVISYVSGQIVYDIDNDGNEIKYPKPIFNFKNTSINLNNEIKFGNSNMNIKLKHNDILGCIFYVCNNGRITFCDNINVISDKMNTNVNYGFFVDKSRYMNTPINIKNMDLGENNIIYLKQYVVWLDINGEFFTSTKSPSYVAISLIQENLNNMKSTSNDNLKHIDDKRSFPLNLCFGKLPSSDIQLKTKLTIVDNDYFNVDDLNILVENGNSYFGKFLSENSECIYNLTPINVRLSALLYEFISFTPIFVGDTKCKIEFSKVIGDETYVIPKPLNFTIFEGDTQDIVVKAGDNNNFVLDEYNLSDVDKQLKISMIYKCILPLRLYVSVISSGWIFPLRFSTDNDKENYIDINNFNYIFDNVNETTDIYIKSVNDIHHTSGDILLEFKTQNKNKKQLNSYYNKIHIEDKNDVNLIKISKDNMNWSNGKSDNRINFLQNLIGSVYLNTNDFNSSIIYSDVDFYIKNNVNCNESVQFNISNTSNTSNKRFNIVVYDNEQERNLNFNNVDINNKSIILELHNIPKHIYARIFFNGDDIDTCSTQSLYENKTFNIDITQNNMGCYTYGDIITEKELFIKYKDKWVRGKLYSNFTTELIINVDENEDIMYDYIIPFKSNEVISYETILKNDKFPDIKIKDGVICNSNVITMKHNFLSEIVYGKRYYEIENTTKDFLAPKIKFILNEINTRGIEIFIDRNKMLDVDASDNLYVKEYDVITYKPNGVTRLTPTSRRSYIKGYIILKSKPLENCIFTISCRDIHNIQSKCLRKKLGDNYTISSSSLDFMFNDVDYNNPILQEFYVDISTFCSSSDNITFSLSSNYSFYNTETSDIDYRSLKISPYDFITYDFENTIDTYYEVEYINLGIYMIAVDENGNLVIKKRNKISTDINDFATTKILDTY